MYVDICHNYLYSNKFIAQFTYHTRAGTVKDTSCRAKQQMAPSSLCGAAISNPFGREGRFGEVGESSADQYALCGSPISVDVNSCCACT
jgi:hypothetical protein